MSKTIVDIICAVDSKADSIARGRKAAFKLLNDRNPGEHRDKAAQRLFQLSAGDCNTTDTERWFDEGFRAQLNDLGFEEE